MVLLDANIVLRYLLEDNPESTIKAVAIIDSEKSCYIRNEVLAEIVYVLSKTYQVPRAEVCSVLQRLMTKDNVHLESKPVAARALFIFDQHKLDFVDSLLYAYAEIQGAVIVSFDKKLNKLLDRISANGKPVLH